MKYLENLWFRYRWQRVVKRMKKDHDYAKNIMRKYRNQTIICDNDEFKKIMHEMADHIEEWLKKQEKQEKQD